ncbi:MAG: GNAT family N-acetyltransferase [Candidatus Eremiobacteraeota bacterium]|nr:GNAT family N-acetyltransferase [Candidatus Eremiobacteraeota bacterium]
MTAAIREAHARDLAAILTIASTLPWDKTRYLTDALANGHAFVAEGEDGVVAFAVWNREFFSLPFLWLVVTEPHHRGFGIATRLLEEFERRAGPGRVFSSTNASNATMQRIFERFGYERCGDLDLDPGDREIFYVKTARS